MKHAIEKGSAWALVTGASSGIGLQIAHQLAGLGYNLAIVSRDDNALARAQQQIATEHGIEVRRLTLDLVARDAATKLHDWTSSQRLEIEILVNNAGAFSFLDVTESSPERIEQLIGLHVVTPTLTCRLYGAEMVRRGHGRILNMSSYSIWMPLPGLALYSASKDVTAVCPAGVATDLYGLPRNLQQFGCRIGVLITARKCARQALRAMFRGRKVFVPAGWVRIFVPILSMLPRPITDFARRHTMRFQK